MSTKFFVQIWPLKRSACQAPGTGVAGEFRHKSLKIQELSDCIGRGQDYHDDRSSSSTLTSGSGVMHFKFRLPSCCWPTAMTLVLVLALPVGAPADVLAFNAVLSGANQEPPNASLGTGLVMVLFDLDLVTMQVDVDFSDLEGTSTVAHIHAATATPFMGNAGVATTVPTFPGFPVGVTTGTYFNTFDMTLASSYNPAYITANGGTPLTAFAALVSAAENGQAYFNLHSTLYPAGEIRGFLTAVPEPSTVGVMGLGLIGMALTRSRRRSMLQA
jgi:hypothetical protein